MDEALIIRSPVPSTALRSELLADENKLPHLPFVTIDNAFINDSSRRQAYFTTDAQGKVEHCSRWDNADLRKGVRSAANSPAVSPNARGIKRDRFYGLPLSVSADLTSAVNSVLSNPRHVAPIFVGGLVHQPHPRQLVVHSNQPQLWPIKSWAGTTTSSWLPPFYNSIDDINNSCKSLPVSPQLLRSLNCSDGRMLAGASASNQGLIQVQHHELLSAAASAASQGFPSNMTSSTMPETRPELKVFRSESALLCDPESSQDESSASTRFHNLPTLQLWCCEGSHAHLKQSCICFRQLHSRDRKSTPIADDGVDVKVDVVDNADDGGVPRMINILQNINHAHIYQKRMRRQGSSLAANSSGLGCNAAPPSAAATASSAVSFKKILRDRYLSSSSGCGDDNVSADGREVECLSLPVWSPLQQPVIFKAAKPPVVLDGVDVNVIEPTAADMRADAFERFRDNKWYDNEAFSPDCRTSSFSESSPVLSSHAQHQLHQQAPSHQEVLLRGFGRECRLGSAASNCSSHLSTDLESQGDPFSPISPSMGFSSSSGYFSPMSPRGAKLSSTVVSSRTTSYGLSPLAMTPQAFTSSHVANLSHAIRMTVSNSCTSESSCESTRTMKSLCVPTLSATSATEQRLVHSAPQTPQYTRRLSPYFVFPPPLQSGQITSVCQTAPTTPSSATSKDCIICPVCNVQCSTYEMLAQHSISHSQTVENTNLVNVNSPQSLSPSPSASSTAPSVTARPSIVFDGGDAKSPKNLSCIPSNNMAGAGPATTNSSTTAINVAAADRQYLCQRCGRSFARSDMLSRHIRLHTGHKPYECLICDQSFSRSDHLKTHMRTHTGEKPYRCSMCHYSACRRDMITRHMKIHRHHLKSTEPSIMTDTISCSKGFSLDYDAEYSLTEAAAPENRHGEKTWKDLLLKDLNDTLT